MADDALDRPAWNALSTRHAHLAEGGASARAYPEAIVPFVGTPDESDASLDALAALIRQRKASYLLQAPSIRLPPTIVADLAADGVQMVADGALPRIQDERITPLGPGDAQEMLDLALLTKPGPFTLQAMRIGRFWGIRIGGRLAAMAGERMAIEGQTEVSGVCTHPDFRGQGLGRLMSAFAAGEVCARGERPFLHAWASNTAAIRLYTSLGFRLRSMMHVASIRAL